MDKINFDYKLFMQNYSEAYAPASNAIIAERIFNEWLNKQKIVYSLFDKSHNKDFVEMWTPNKINHAKRKAHIVYIQDIEK